MSARRALVTGITGQDGSYLAELLLEKGYEVHGLARNVRGGALANIAHLDGELELTAGDVRDVAVLRDVLARTQPAEIYHLAAPTFVPDSWEDPAGTLQAIAGSTATLLALVRELASPMRVYVASSSEIFGDAGESPQSESSPCRPTTPYGVAKLASHLLVGTLRARDGLHACSGITFNHESTRRPERFVTRRVTRGAAAIKLGLAGELTLGDLDAVRDWSHAADVMRGAWQMLQAEHPSDYVLASGVGRTVRQLVEVAFACVDLTPSDYLRVDPELARANPTTPPVGDPSQAREQLGWEAQTSFERMIEQMVAADLDELGGAVR